MKKQETTDADSRTKKYTVKACPFCGGRPWPHNAEKWYMECESCKAESGTGNTIDEAIRLWNNRIPKWIPVSEKLPDAWTVVAAMTEYGDWVGAYIDNNEEWHVTKHSAYIEAKIICWMNILLPVEEYQYVGGTI